MAKRQPKHSQHLLISIPVGWIERLRSGICGRHLGCFSRGGVTHPWETSASRLVSMTFWAPKVGSTKVTEKLVGQGTAFHQVSKLWDVGEISGSLWKKIGGLAVGVVVLWEMGDGCFGELVEVEVVKWLGCQWNEPKWVIAQATVLIIAQQTSWSRWSS